MTAQHSFPIATVLKLKAKVTASNIEDQPESHLHRD